MWGWLARLLFNPFPDTRALVVAEGARSTSLLFNSRRNTEYFFQGLARAFENYAQGASDTRRSMKMFTSPLPTISLPPLPCSPPCFPYLFAGNEPTHVFVTAAAKAMVTEDAPPGSLHVSGTA